MLFRSGLYLLGPITFITARNAKYNFNTRNWLLNNVPFSFALANKSSGEKTSFLVKNHFDIFVEDRLRTANQASETGIRTYLVNRPWNENRPTHCKVIRIDDLEHCYINEVKMYS